MRSKPRRVGREIGNTIQVGMPSTLHRDFYFYLMRWTWPQVFALLGATYLLSNILFATLFYIQPGAIANVRPGSFTDCFFFSVQTMATIGYGTMAPNTLYAHIIVTIEAAVGLMGVAMCTGVMFARLSRAKAKVIFSDSFVVTKRNGIPTLCIRAANARGNDLVEATVGVVMMVQEVTPEGHKMRKMLDLQLERSRSPFFRLSWTILHPIDEKSPFFKIDWENLDENFLGIMVSLMGFDGTYGQTVFTRKIYYPENLRYRHRFADVLSDLPDGKIMFDYAQFHIVFPDQDSDQGI